jgi:hypothetical protein
VGVRSRTALQCTAIDQQCPTQASGLDITELDDGLVVFEPTTRRVHHLNSTAAVVFELCTGSNDSSAMADVLATAFELDEPPTDEVLETLATLRRERLIV